MEIHCDKHGCLGIWFPAIDAEREANLHRRDNPNCSVKLTRDTAASPFTLPSRSIKVDFRKTPHPKCSGCGGCLEHSACARLRKGGCKCQERAQLALDAPTPETLDRVRAQARRDAQELRERYMHEFTNGIIRLDKPSH